MIFFFAVFSYPKDAHAGVFSFVDKLFASESPASKSIPSQNSQNMPLLEAVSNPTAHNEKVALSIVNGNAIETQSGPSGTPVEIHEKELSDKISVYTVRSGDTLQAIANMFGVSVNTIIWANDLKSSKDIRKDQTLIILPISGVKYIVKKGDTLKSIASSFKGDLDEILRFNDLTADSAIHVGDEIIIPDGELAVAVSPAKTTAKSTGSLVDASGYFMRPVVGGTRTQGAHGSCRCGVDLASKYGVPVYAAAGGTVIVSKTSGWNGGYGNYIVVSHANGTQTLYAHLSSNFVSVGESVSKGDQIGGMGSSGNSTGTHLHFEIRGAKNPF